MSGALTPYVYEPPGPPHEVELGELRCAIVGPSGPGRSTGKSPARYEPGSVVMLDDPGGSSSATYVVVAREGSTRATLRRVHFSPLTGKNAIDGARFRLTVKKTLRQMSREYGFRLPRAWFGPAVLNEDDSL